MNELSQLKEIARELRRLRDASPAEASSLSVWYEESRAFAARLDSEFAGIDLPEEVWHFLSDADIRARSSQFRAVQLETIDAVIEDLERGVVPLPRGSTVALGSRGMLLAAAILVVALMAWVAL